MACFGKKARPKEPAPKEETVPQEDKPAEQEEAPKPAEAQEAAEAQAAEAQAPGTQEAADGAKEELEALRKEVDCLRKENEELHQQMRLAERKAADLEDELTKQRAAAEAARSTADETKAEDKPAAAPLRRDSPAPRPASRAASSAQPEPAAAAEAAEAAEAAAAEETAAAAAEETPQEEDKESPSPMPAVAASQSLQADKPTPQDSAAAAAEETAAAAEEDTAAAASAASPSQAASRQSSVKWLRSFLSGASSRKESSTSVEPLFRSLGGSRSQARQLSAACMRCQELEKEKVDLQAKLATANAQGSHLSSNAGPEKEKNQALVARVRNVVKETAVRVDRLQGVFEAAMKEALAQHQKAQRARLHYYGRRKGLEMRIAALLDKVYELEMADPIMPPKPRRLPRASVVRPSIAETVDSFDGADGPYLLLQLQEDEGEGRQASQGASSAGRRQTVLVPAHLFDEAAARTAQQRAAAAAQPRPTVVLPAYAFDELALRRAQERAAAGQQGRPSIALPPFLFGGEKAGERRDAALAKRPTVAVPAHVFDEAAAKKAFERETDDNRRRPTTAVPTFLFREPRNHPARISTTTLPAEWFADDAAGDRQQQQQQQGGDDPSRQSSFFPSNFFGSFFRRSKEEEEEGAPSSPQQEQPEPEEGPSLVTDEEHAKRKAEPVVVAAEGEEEAVFPEVAKEGARIRQLTKQESLRASSVDTPREVSQDTAGITAPEADASKPTGEDSFVTAPCCGRSTPPSDVRPFKRCGCQVCRKCLKTASMQAKVHLNNFVGSDPKTGSPIWKVRCPSCGLVAPLTTTQLRIASIKRVDAA